MRLPYYLLAEDVPHPVGWDVSKVEDLYEQLAIGVRRDQKSSFAAGLVPVVDQSESSYLGFHDDEPGVLASPDRPVVTFANHTCAMRVMTRPFSVIQNVFPKVGRDTVCDTLFLYYTTNGRTQTEEYKGHHPQWRSGYVPLPPLPTQRRIASVLSAYDDLIANNTRRIAILENMARTIYREWFVEFRYPGHEGVPLVESEFGPIPEGWVATPVGEAISFHIGGGWGKEEADQDHSENARVIRGTDIPAASRLSVDTCPDRFHKPSNLKSRRLRAGDIVMEVSGGSTDQSVGRSLLVSDEILHALGGVDVICASFCKLLRPDPARMLPEVMYLNLLDLHESNGIDKYQVQSTGIKNLKFKPFLDGHLIAVPPLAIQRAFVAVVGPVYSMLSALGLAVGNLRQTRDLLLPKLVSGELEISDPDIVLGVSA